MALEFKLPDVGEGIAEGEVVRWIVKEGDLVAEDQPLVEVMTDKATVEIPSPVRGRVVKLLAAEGQIVKVGQGLLVLEEEGAPAAPAAGGPAAPVGRRTAPGAGAAPRPLAAPAVRQRARQMGIDLERVTGSGPGGRITLEDLERAATGRPGARPAAPPTAARPGAAAAAAPRGEERIPLRGVRRRIAEHLVASARTAPHYWYVDDVDMTEVVALRRAALPDAERRGVKLTYLPFVIRALIPALKEFPLLNSSLDDEKGEIVLKRYYGIGIATDTVEGLMVPVVKEADRRTLWDLAREIERLVTAARQGKIALPDLQGGTFTITSAGSIGGLMAFPILNHPEVAILGVHRIAPRPVVREGEVVVREMMSLSIGLDHRVVDGAVAARFMNALIRRLEHPALSLLEEE